MIIDVHGYMIGPDRLYAEKAYMFGEAGWSVSPHPPDEEAVLACARRNVEALDAVGTDVQFIGPRPYQLGTDLNPPRVVHQWIALLNDVMAMQARSYPDRLRCLAALPQLPRAPLHDCFDEIERVAQDSAFVGVLLNPDPAGGETPGLGDEYWYPLWERLVRLELPALVVPAKSHSDRESYSSHYVTEASIAVLSLLENRRLFDDFPSLRLVIGYGGGSIPYQAGRWRLRRLRQPDRESFDASLRRLYFDTVVHTPQSMEMLLRVCGPDRCLFGTQRLGACSAIDPATGRAGDDLKPLVEGVAWLSAEQRNAVLSGNALDVFSRFRA